VGPFIRFSTKKISFTGSTACNKGSTAVFKTECRGSPFIQEKYQENSCDKRKRLRRRRMKK
jgi:hypothetical protein